MFSELNQRAVLLARTLTPDDGGGFTESWAVVGEAWIAVKPLTAYERYGPDAKEVRVRHRITLRARPDVVVGMRLTASGRSFTVHAVMEHAAADPEMTLLCEELP